MQRALASRARAPSAIGRVRGHGYQQVRYAHKVGFLCCSSPLSRPGLTIAGPPVRRDGPTEPAQGRRHPRPRSGDDSRTKGPQCAYRAELRLTQDYKG
jgi:hypothetical protein